MERGFRSRRQTGPPFLPRELQKGTEPRNVNQLKGRDNREAKRSGQEKFRCIRILLSQPDADVLQINSNRMKP
ncbi:hypothetical protein llap_17468 [Limosa lapponica baueri]|uniref:Uncharacterized protein n=1 Tax=Limosa lapponica baueri TaxID=1758121 RepID=A0A2I0TEJ9_LIMLA|nr:hypothetical protein llap_17468 [Limosa lapponica baueri]